MKNYLLNLSLRFFDDGTVMLMGRKNNIARILTKTETNLMRDMLNFISMAGNSETVVTPTMPAPANLTKSMRMVLGHMAEHNEKACSTIIIAAITGKPKGTISSSMTNLKKLAMVEAVEPPGYYRITNKGLVESQKS